MPCARLVCVARSLSNHAAGDDQAASARTCNQELVFDRLINGPLDSLPIGDRYFTASDIDPGQHEGHFSDPELSVSIATMLAKSERCYSQPERKPGIARVFLPASL